MPSRWRPAATRSFLGRLPHRVGMPLRRHYYVHQRRLPAKQLPGPIRRRLGVDDPTAVGSRKVELGPGQRPRPGYIHLDTDPWADHVEYVIRDGRLPLADRWADELLAIHVLEHVPPARLIATLQDWRRCLRPGGTLQVHVPDSRRLCRQFAEEPDIGRKWALMGALLGMYANPGVRRPEELAQPCDHHVLFDVDVLRWALTEAGFRNIEDLTADETDVHTEGWAPLVPNISLIFRAERPA